MGRLQDAVVRVFTHTDRGSAPHAVVTWVVNLSLAGSPAAGHTRAALDSGPSPGLGGGGAPPGSGSVCHAVESLSALHVNRPCLCLSPTPLLHKVTFCF